MKDANLAELAKQVREFIEKAAYYFAGPGDCLGYTSIPLYLYTLKVVLKPRIREVSVC